MDSSINAYESNFEPDQSLSISQMVQEALAGSSQANVSSSNSDLINHDELQVSKNLRRGQIISRKRANENIQQEERPSKRKRNEQNPFPPRVLRRRRN